jgi:hypothetical protein
MIQPSLRDGFDWYALYPALKDRAKITWPLRGPKTKQHAGETPALQYAVINMEIRHILSRATGT